MIDEGCQPVVGKHLLVPFGMVGQACGGRRGGIAGRVADSALFDRGLALIEKGGNIAAVLAFEPGLHDLEELGDAVDEARALPGDMNERRCADTPRLHEPVRLDRHEKRAAISGLIGEIVIRGCDQPVEGRSLGWNDRPACDFPIVFAHEAICHAPQDIAAVIADRWRRFDSGGDVHRYSPEDGWLEAASRSRIAA